MADHPSRHATWLELFYDLVYVVSIAAITARFAKHIDLEGLLWFLGLMVAVWLAWATHTFFFTRFDRNSQIQRALTLLQMLAAAAMAVALSAGDPSLHLVEIGVAYALIKLCLICLYLDACRFSEEARKFSVPYLPVEVVSAALWLAGAFVPPPLTYILWAGAVGVNLIVPTFILEPLFFRTIRVDTEHMPERFGLFTIIILGEAILATVVGVHEVDFDVASGVAAASGFAIAVAIWANYFNYVERAPLQCSLGNGNRYAVPHLALVVGLVAAAVGVEHAIVETSHSHVEPSTGYLIAGGLIAFLFAFGFIQAATYPATERTRILSTYGVAIVILGVLGIIGPRLNSVVLLVFALVVVSLVALFDVRGRASVPSRAYVARDREGNLPAKRGPKDYLGDGFVVSFDAAICEHSGDCLRGLPEVFDVAKRPWVNTDGAAEDVIVRVVGACPTGALNYRKSGNADAGTADAAADGETTPLIKPRADGPLVLHGRFEIVDADGKTVRSGERTILCRCGESGNKPFCDGSHRKTEFKTG